MKEKKEFEILDAEMTDDHYISIRKQEASKIINLLISIVLVYTSGGLLTNDQLEEPFQCIYLGLSMLPAIIGIANITSVLKFKRGLFDKYLTRIFDLFLGENSEKGKKLTK